VGYKKGNIRGEKDESNTLPVVSIYGGRGHEEKDGRKE